jgi:hypothetical protein
VVAVWVVARPRPPGPTCSTSWTNCSADGHLAQAAALLVVQQAGAPLGDASAPAELAPLMTALNGHLGRIDRMLHSERRFIADAAHELRTPIAAIRVQAQVAADEVDAEARRHALRATLEGCDRAVRVVEQLLMLSRLEAGAEVRRQPVDLDALAQQLVAELTPRALRRHQDLGFERGGPCVLAGDAVLLGVLLRNLIDNALRYSPEGASVTGVRLPRLPRPAGADRRACGRRRRRPGADAHRRRQEPVLPGAGHRAPPRRAGGDGGGQPADRADARPGRRAGGSGRASRLPELHAGRRRGPRASSASCCQPAADAAVRRAGAHH